MDSELVLATEEKTRFERSIMVWFETTTLLFITGSSQNHSIFNIEEQYYKFINHYQYSLKYSESMCSLRATVCWRTRSFCLHSKPKMEVGTWTFHVLQKTLTILVIVLYLSGSRFFCPLPCRLESRCTEPPGPLAGGPVFYFHRTVWSADWVIKMLLFWGCS